MSRALKAYIDCAALKFNLARIRALAPQSSVLAMIKANGYGHSLVLVALALQSAEAFGVACIEEAKILRKAGIQNRIVLMEGFFEEKELPEIMQLQLECVIHHQEQLNALKNLVKTGFLLKNPLSIWIKINTGMHRLGFPIEKVMALWKEVSALSPSAIKVEGFMTHFAKADELESEETVKQMNRFFEVTKGLPGARSLANSAAILGWPASHGDWIRPGITLYGVSPFLGRVGSEEGLKPVMTLCSEIIAIQTPKAGESIGYGGTFTCPKDMRIGIVAVGYGDGYPRLSPTGTPVLVNHQKVPLVGRVSMDMITIDLSSVPNAKIGDPVQLWGPQLPVEEVANAIGTTGYELLTGLSTRVPFQVLNNT